MSENRPAIIPPDFVCDLRVRVFKQTMIHETGIVLFPDQRVRGSGGLTVPVRHFCGPSNCLAHYLAFGWPDPGSAAWNNGDKVVSIYADDVFLCPQCGRFASGATPDGKSRQPWPPFEVDQEKSQERTSIYDTFVVPTDFDRLREFAQSRITAKEFYFKECNDTDGCQTFRRVQLTRYKKDYSVQKVSHSILKTLTGPSVEVEREKPEALKDLGAEFVYLLEGGEYHKIGIASEPQKRLSGIRTSCPFPVKFVKTWKSCNAPRTERAMHSHFKAFRVNGEWFRLPSEILAQLVALETVDDAFPEAPKS